METATNIAISQDDLTTREGDFGMNFPVDSHTHPPCQKRASWTLLLQGCWTHFHAAVRHNFHLPTVTHRLTIVIP